MKTIEIDVKFDVGDTVWTNLPQYGTEYIPCPRCDGFGKAKLPTGKEMVCQLCYGKEKITQDKIEEYPALASILEIHVRRISDRAIVKYCSIYSNKNTTWGDGTDIFLTKEECIAYIKAKKERTGSNV